MSTKKRNTFLLVATISVLLVSAACGGGSDEPEFLKVNASNKSYSVGDFESVGFKVVKEYDVEGLTGATAAMHGFLRESGQTPQSYELRFYESHDEAVEMGTAFADEVTGEDPVLFAGEMMWSDAVKQEKEALFEGGGAQAFYKDYAIFGNVVMLCEGDWSEQSLEVCAQLQDVVDGVVSG